MDGLKTNIVYPLFKVHMPESVIEPLKEVLFSGYIGQGKKVEEFESIFGEWINNKNVVTVNSCTSALQLALRLVGVGVGDEVLTVSMTCFATNAPILALGAKPIWVEIDNTTGVIDINDLALKCNSKVKAIVCVDFGGIPCDYNAINAIAVKHGIKVIEDAAHSLGTTYDKKKTGNHADYVCFSLQAIKHITCGDGGVLVCKDEKDVEKAKLLRWYGIDRNKQGRDLRCNDDIVDFGYKFHMNDMNAVIAIEQMKYIDGIIEKHKTNAKTYEWGLSECEDFKPIKYNEYSSYWLYPVIVKNKEKATDFMLSKGVQVSSVHRPNHTYSVFKDIDCKLPQTEDYFNHMLCLPVGWWMKREDIKKVIEFCYEY